MPEREFIVGNGIGYIYGLAFYQIARGIGNDCGIAYGICGYGRSAETLGLDGDDSLGISDIVEG